MKSSDAATLICFVCVTVQCAILYDIFIAVSACLITAFVRRRVSEMERNVCNERLIFININLIKYLEWLCSISHLNL